MNEAAEQEDEQVSYPADPESGMPMTDLEPSSASATAREDAAVRDDEREIRALIERWAAAAHAGDLASVLVQHAEDIVMFDVPPPDDGVRGLDAYEATWPPFFEWQRSGASFEIVELGVTAGADVAFAWALLRCGTDDEFREDPNRRLRLTVGLRREGGRWVVAHEHHSFPDKS